MTKACKNLLSMVLVLAMVISVITIPVGAHPSSGTLVQPVGNAFDLNFNYDTDTTLTQTSGAISKNGGSYKADTTDWANYFQIMNSSIGTAKGAYVEATNKYLVVGSDGTSTNGRGRFLIADWQPSVTKGRYTTEFKFNMPELSNHKYLFRAHNNSAGVEVGYGDNGVLKAGTTPINFEFAANQWYTVKADIDIPNWKYDLYIDGALVAKDVAFTSNFATAEKTDITQFERVFEFDTYSKGLVYLDDISIYKQTVSVKKYTDTAADMFAAVYNAQGVLKDCVVVKNVAEGTHYIGANAPNGSKLVFYVWANDGSLRPLMKAYTAK